MLWLFYITPGPHKSVHFGFDNLISWGLDDWLVVAEAVPCLLKYHQRLLSLCTDLEIVINWEKLDLKPKQSSVCQSAVRHNTGEVLDVRFPDYQIRRYGIAVILS